MTTLHGQLDLPDLPPLFGAFSYLLLVSFSHDQRRPMPPVRWLATVHHGLPRDLMPFTPKPACPARGARITLILNRGTNGRPSFPGSRSEGRSGEHGR